MIPVRRGLVAGTALLVVLLAGLGATVGLTAAGWIGGLACGAALHEAVRRGGPRVLGPADVVTVTRAVLGCAVAALVVDSFVEPVALPIVVVLAAVALSLDAVDGQVARRTHTESAFGARFDGEADAFLILVLSGYVAAEVAWWVLAIGAARYVFFAAGWWAPWLRGRLPARRWRKVVAAVQGVVLLVATAVGPEPWTTAALVVALVLLAESFGRDVLWLWRRRPHPATAPAGISAAPRLRHP